MVLHAGTNNVPHESSATVTDRFDKIIEGIQESVPGITVFVSAILPRDVSFFPGAKNNINLIDRCNQHAIAINYALRARRDVIFIDHLRCGSDRRSANRSLLSRDGLGSPRTFLSTKLTP